jgi:phosphate-selective porin OprO/OprP
MPFAQADVAQEDIGFQVSWQEGLRLETQDKVFKLRMGGMIQNDWAWMGEDDRLKAVLGDLGDGTEFRRIRLYTAGTIYKLFQFKLQLDFAGGDADLKDAYISLKEKLPWYGYIKVGHFKEPFSLEQLTSSKYITFLERSLVDVFAPARNTGLELGAIGLEERLTISAGIFRDSDSYGKGSGEGEYNATFRVTGLPWYEDNGKQLIHVGMAYTHRSPHDDQVRIYQRPEVHLAPRFVDTGTLGADAIDLLGVELAFVYGVFSVQGEYISARVNTPVGSNPRFSGYYVYSSYFLTGEHRRYMRDGARYCRVRPRANFLGEQKGLGAWEVAARYSMLDLNDETVTGGELSNVTFGLNWYLNPAIKIMWNYLHVGLDGVGKAGFFLIRFQLDF